MLEESFGIDPHRHRSTPSSPYAAHSRLPPAANGFRSSIQHLSHWNGGSEGGKSSGSDEEEEEEEDDDVEVEVEEVNGAEGEGAGGHDSDTGMVSWVKGSGGRAEGITR